jgi:hypothetical protein
MKKFTSILTITLALAFVPALALAHCGSCAMDDKSGGSQKLASKHDHGDQKDHAGHDHSGMAAAGGMLDLGAKAEKGVKATAEMKDVRAAMAKTGMKTTHHFMISFADEKSGQALDAGTVAVKVVDPAGTVTGPMALMGMQGHFGADVILDKNGEYTFQVGSKLADGQVRQYEFKTTIK